MVDNSQQYRFDEGERGYQLVRSFVRRMLALGMFVALMIPLFIIGGMKNGNLGVFIITFLIWAYGFYQYANYLNDKKIIGAKVSFTLSILMVIASFFL